MAARAPTMRFGTTGYTVVPDHEALEDRTQAFVSQGVGFNSDQVNNLATKAFATSILDNSPKPVVGPAFLDAGELAMDFSSLFRVSYCYHALDVDPALGIGADAVNSGMGLSTLLNVLNGMCVDQIAKQRLAESSQVLDKRGATAAKMLRFKAWVQITVGLGWGTTRGLGLGSILQGAVVSPTAPTMLGRVTFWFGSVATGILIFYFLINMIYVSVNAWERHHTLGKLERGATVNEGLDYIHKRVMGGDQESKRYQEFFDDDITTEQERINFIAKEGAKRLFITIQSKPDGVPELVLQKSEEELVELFKGMLSAMTEETRNAQIEDAFNLSMQEKKTHKIDRVFGAGTAEFIRGVLTEIENGSKDPNVGYLEIINKIEGVSSKTDKEQIALMLFFAFAIVAMVGTFVFIASTSLIFLIVMSLLGILVDGYYFCKDYQTGNVAKYDSTLAKVGFALGVTAFVVTIVALSILSAGVVPLVVAGVIGLVWIIMQVSIMVLAHQKRMELEAAGRGAPRVEVRRPAVPDLDDQDYDLIAMNPFLGSDHRTA